MSWDSEISWAILDGAGTEIAAGGFGEGTTEVTGYCPSCLDPTDLSGFGCHDNNSISKLDCKQRRNGLGIPSGSGWSNAC